MCESDIYTAAHYGEFVPNSQVCRKRLQPQSKMFADARHEQQHESIAIAAAQLVTNALECIRLQALVGIAQLRSEKQGPLRPQKEYD